MSEPSLPAGMRANRPPRAGLTGTWWQAPGPAGGDRGVLRFTLDNAPAGAAQRLAAAVQAVNTLDYSGFLPSGELLQHEGAYWLVTAQPASPTLIELARSGVRGIDIGSVATIVNETAQSLAELHGAGLVHGGVQGETVIITSTGAAKLAEAGLLPALRGERLEPSVGAANDRRAWAELVRAMVVEWGGSGAGADLIRRCAQLGEQDLNAAVQALHAGSEVLPKGFSKRGALTTAVAGFNTLTANQAANQAAAAPPAPISAVPPPAPSSAAPISAVPMSPVPVAPAQASTVPLPPEAPAAPGTPDENEFATRLAKRAGGVQSARSPMAAPPLAPPVSPAPVAPVTPAYPPGPYVPAPAQYSPGQAQVGRPQSPAQQEVRIGPGVARGGGVTQTHWQPGGTRRPRSVGKVVTATISALLTVVLVGYLLASIAGYTGNTFLQLANFVEITDIKVDAPQPTAGNCDVAVPLTGLFLTNGNGGEIRFQWEFEGGAPIVRKVVAKRGANQVKVHAIWNIGGAARTLTGTLRVNSPGTGAIPFTIKYTCKK